MPTNVLQPLSDHIRMLHNSCKYTQLLWTPCILKLAISKGVLPYVNCFYQCFHPFYVSCKNPNLAVQHRLANMNRHKISLEIPHHMIYKESGSIVHDTVYNFEPSTPNFYNIHKCQVIWQFFLLGVNFQATNVRIESILYVKHMFIACGICSGAQLEGGGERGLKPPSPKMGVIQFFQIRWVFGGIGEGVSKGRWARSWMTV